MIAQIDLSYLKVRPWKLWARLVSYILFEGRPLTTRGQWINPLVFGLFKLEKKLPQLKQVEKPVFVLGTGRSGTTILGVILSMHKDVGFLNEPKALWHSIYPDEDLIGSYSLGTASYRLGSENITPQIKEQAHRLYGAYLRATFSSRVVDKYPELIFRMPFVLDIFPDAKFLFLVRNGWDTCHSINFWSDRLGVSTNEDTHDWWGVNRRKWNLLVNQIIPEYKDLAPFSDEMRTWTNQRDMAAVEWIVTMREGIKAEKEHPDSLFRINYEDLCVADNNLLEGIVKFLGLDVDDVSFLKYARETLKQPSHKKEFPLHSSIEAPFRETMRLCGY